MQHRIASSVSRLQKHVDFNSILTLFCMACVLVYMHNGRHIVLTQIEANRATIDATSARDEKLVLDFMSRTVDRWDKFQRDNPDIKVPAVREPINKAHLSEKDMERATPSPALPEQGSR